MEKRYQKIIRSLSFFNEKTKLYKINKIDNKIGKWKKELVIHDMTSNYYIVDYYYK